ncbi:MAG TPA: bifunctional phosphoribosylaminoimidazolecarboxamide formyltransferase/IMP cyclohydrolase, partial [Methylomirabilota bacterium]|nr:bifunctional phosphoribosylaminoimidazolecarboxamide formyltransferase/IMP cyclohydrolase [Methylomirabilota bacterium]
MRALLSVSDREGIVELARGLIDAGAECFATDGTRAHLAEAGLDEIRPVSDLTETNEILGGRVKTLHPSIFAGLLARRDRPDHLAQLAEHGIEQIDLVVVNLYPFARTIREPDTSLDQALEQIDIGGVALLRAAAKNFPGVAAVSSPTQYALVVRDIKTQGGVSAETRQKLAAEAFAVTASYDAQIAAYLNGAAGTVFPSRMTMVVEKKADLRYGENPHQLGAFYTDPSHPGGSISGAHQIAGKDLSFNNLLDLDAAWTIASDFRTPAVAIVKHGNPCGLASVVD